MGLGGLAVCKSEQTSFDDIGLNIFRRRCGAFLSVYYFDHADCHCATKSIADDQACSKCSQSRVKPHKSGCSPLFFKSSEGLCYKFLDKKIQSTTMQPFLLDVPAERQREPVCLVKEEIPCGKWIPQCFKVTDICIYTLNQRKELIPCKNGGHMESCQHFECNMMFKCPKRYCVPWRYACDGKWDCPLGSDERVLDVCHQTATCSGLFKCASAKTKCIHLGNVCDGTKDCVDDDDDEKLCELTKLTCPGKCSCMAFAMHCAEGNETSFFCEQSCPFISLTLISVQIAKLEPLLQMFERALFLTMNKINISYFVTDKVFQKIVLLNLASNFLAKVLKESFGKLFDLRILLLQDNQINCLEPKAFVDLHSLKKLDLSSNSFLSFPETLFRPNTSLIIFVVKNTEIREKSLAFLHDMSLTVLDTTEFYTCCNVATSTVCTGTKVRAWFMSCSALLPNPAMKIVSVCLILALILVSVCSLVSLYYKKFCNAFKVTVSCVSILFDFQTLYLVVIWASDLHFNKSYPSKETQWRSSIQCFATYNLYLWTSLVIPIEFSVLSLSRWRVVESPIKTKFKKVKYCVKYLASSCLLVFLVSCAFTVWMALSQTMVPNNLCSPFADPNYAVIATKIITVFATGVQFVCASISTAWHILLVSACRKGKTEIESAVSTQLPGRTSDRPLVVQLSILSISTFIGMAPYVCYIAMFFMPSYPLNFLVWTTIIGCQLNALTTSLIFLVFFVR